VAELIKHYFPKMIDIHNYSAANSVQQKLYNWETLNRKVIKRLGYQVHEKKRRRREEREEKRGKRRVEREREKGRERGKALRRQVPRLLGHETERRG
jgi:hypothetical protein